MKNSYILGIDIGSVSIALALLTLTGEKEYTLYKRHYGNVLGTLQKTLPELEEKYDISYAAVTGTGAELVAEQLGAHVVNEIVAQVLAAEKFFPKARSIMDIGGQDSAFIQLEALNQNGKDVLRLKDFSVSAMCASGTGSFLDQQATRLGLNIEEEFGVYALKAQNAARIAGRCSVFAKSDMIHLQQKGSSVESIVAGLCYALARSFRATVVGVKTLELPVAFVGGVAANQGVVAAMKDILQLSDESFFVPQDFSVSAALGAAVFLLFECQENLKYKGVQNLQGKSIQFASTTNLAPLCDASCKEKDKLNSTEIKPNLHPLQEKESTEIEKTFLDNSIQCQTCLPLTEITPVFLGIDIGSISTNLVMINTDGVVLAKYYLLTASRPIEAVRKGFNDIKNRYGNKAHVVGVGVTGSGRHLIGDLVGADVIVNEITAHAAAASFICPQADTVFEIGGQDSKYISLENGLVKDFTMNKACAAGTGSFLEEQAEKLGIDIRNDFSNLAFTAQKPVDCGEQCTVFIDSEVVRHQQNGTPLQDIVAGLAYSIVTNYLHKVVERRPVGDHILFQGGVAFNKAVHAAFESLVGKKILVPDHNEVMGAIGCCLLARQEQTKKAQLTSSFQGFNALDGEYSQKSFQCNICENRCDINTITIDDKKLFYGGRCERYEVQKQKQGKNLQDIFAERENLLLENYTIPENVDSSKVILYPRILTFYEYFPFFHAFFRELGFTVLLSPPSNASIIRTGVACVTSPTCFPTKVAHGHAAWAYEALKEGKGQWIFVPAIHETMTTAESHSMANHCSYIQFIPHMVEDALHLDTEKTLLKPKFHFRMGKKQVLPELLSMSQNLGITSKHDVKKAYESATQAQKKFQEKRLELGRKALESLDKNAKNIVIVGKAHTMHDPATNMNISRILRDMGVQAIPSDVLNLYDAPDVGKAWRNMTLAMGQRSMVAAQKVRENPNVHAVYLANFGCVNDSMYPRFFEREMGEKPFLLLEIDEHSAEAGVITRCEAFLDAIKNTTVKNNSSQRLVRQGFDPKGDRTLYLPNAANAMVVWAAVLRAHGVKAQILPSPNERSLELGRSYLDGKECLPCTLMTGDMLRLVKDTGVDPKKIAFFMPGSSGSCRYDLFNTLQNIIFSNIGLEDVALVDEYKKENVALHKITSSMSYSSLAWRSFIAADILERLRMHLRPYEIVPGSIDREYFTSLDILVKAVEKKQNIEKCSEHIVQRMNAVAVDKSVWRPIVGLVGESYLRNVDYSSNNLIQNLEAMGAEVRMPAVMEILWYSLYKQRYLREVGGSAFGAWLQKVQQSYLHRIENNMRRPSLEVLEHKEEKPLWNVIEQSGLPLDAGLGFGAAVEMAQSNVQGIIHAIPFNCVPGTVVQALEGRFRKRFPHVPFITVSFSGQAELGVRIRLEALLHQCKQRPIAKIL